MVRPGRVRNHKIVADAFLQCPRKRIAGGLKRHLCGMPRTAGRMPEGALETLPGGDALRGDAKENGVIGQHTRRILRIFFLQGVDRRFAFWASRLRYPLGFAADQDEPQLRPVFLVVVDQKSHLRPCGNVPQASQSFGRHTLGLAVDGRITKFAVVSETYRNGVRRALLADSDQPRNTRVAEFRSKCGRHRSQNGAPNSPPLFAPGPLGHLGQCQPIELTCSGSTV
jgi:hypothetical protein